MIIRSIQTLLVIIMALSGPLMAFSKTGNIINSYRDIRTQSNNRGKVERNLGIVKSTDDENSYLIPVDDYTDNPTLNCTLRAAIDAYNNGESDRCTTIIPTGSPLRTTMLLNPGVYSVCINDHTINRAAEDNSVNDLDIVYSSSTLTNDLVIRNADPSNGDVIIDRGGGKEAGENGSDEICDSTFTPNGYNRVMELKGQGSASNLNVTFEGVVLRDGKGAFLSNSGNTYGGGNLKIDRANVDGDLSVIRGDVVYSGDIEQLRGGGVDVSWGSFSGNNLEDNTLTRDNSNAYVFGGGLSAFFSTIQVNRIANNSILSTGSGNEIARGGGARVLRGSITVSDEVINNRIGTETNPYSGLATGGGVAILSGNGISSLSQVNSNQLFSNNYSSGGGIYVYNTADEVTISNAQNNSSKGGSAGGGAVTILSSSDVILKEYFHHNISEALVEFSRGGAVHSFGSNITFNNLNLQHNQSLAITSARGGAVYAEGGSVKVTSSIINNNTAEASGYAYGGGLSLKDSELVLNDSVVHLHKYLNQLSNNQVTTTGSPGQAYGGAIYSSNSPLNLNHFHMMYNQVRGTNAFGGGIALVNVGDNSILKQNDGYENVKGIAYNTVYGDEVRGGGIYAFNSDLDLSSVHDRFHILNNKIYATNADSATETHSAYGGGISIRNSSLTGSPVVLGNLAYANRSDVSNYAFGGGIHFINTSSELKNLNINKKVVGNRVYALSLGTGFSEGRGGGIMVEGEHVDVEIADFIGTNNLASGWDLALGGGLDTASLNMASSGTGCTMGSNVSPTENYIQLAGGSWVESAVNGVCD